MYLLINKKFVSVSILIVILFFLLQKSIQSIRHFKHYVLRELIHKLNRIQDTSFLVKLTTTQPNTTKPFIFIKRKEKNLTIIRHKNCILHSRTQRTTSVYVQAASYFSTSSFRSYYRFLLTHWFFLWKY